MMLIQVYLPLILRLVSSVPVENKSKLTLDEFFDYTTFPLLSFSPTGRHLLVQTSRPSWNTGSYENTLWLYDVQNETKKLITTNVLASIKAQWSPSGNFIALVMKNHSSANIKQPEQCIYFYSLVSDELLSVQVGEHPVLAIAWSHNDSTLYVSVTGMPSRTEAHDSYKSQWATMNQYRDNLAISSTTAILRLDLNLNSRPLSSKTTIIRNVPFLMNQLLYVSFVEKLIISSISSPVEHMDDFELYSIDLRNRSTLTKLTNNEAYEIGLQLSSDGQHLLFRTLAHSSDKQKLNDTQYRLYSLNVSNGQIARLGKHFRGSISGYTANSNSGVYILGQLGTEVHIYTQRSSTDDLVHHIGWNGTYESIASSSNSQSIAFVYSSFEKPMEVYVAKNIDQLTAAQTITNENNVFTRRNLPQAKVYGWVNEDDHREIEGILHYPPGEFESKNLPLLVLIHGGPYRASLNGLDLTWYHWATLAASEGWLVLEPNYRGSTGYGDQFLNEIRYRPLSRPGQDILSGVNQLIKDGAVDKNKLAVGGYSYGALITNWLITRTKRFNAALSGAGAVDFTSTWGAMDLPVLISYLFGGFPWEAPHIYQNESPIYQLDKIRTPTHIITGENDIRVPASQSYILERGLRELGVPVKLVSFPKAGHSWNNPWVRKLKVQEELKWLQKYGHQSLNNDHLSNNGERLELTRILEFYFFLKFCAIVFF